MAAVISALLLLALSLGVLPLPLALQGTGLGAVALTGLMLMRRRRCSRGRQLALLTLLLLAGLWGLRGQPRPGPIDPVRRIPTGSDSSKAVLRGRLLDDPQRSAPESSCRVLLQQNGGRSELLFRSCPPLQQGWHVEVSGTLRRPRPAPHPLLSGAAERLARKGSWSQLVVSHWRVLSRPFTPVEDLRRRMASVLLHSGDAASGGVMAALVLGSAVVPVPAAVREAFRAAGLSHALAASGFHLTVLLGAVMVVGRSAARPLRWSLALGAMALFLLLAGPQPSVVRAVAMGALGFVVQESGRRVKPLGLLLLCTLLMLLAAPAWLLDVGFQLSVAATAGLLLSAGPLEQGLKRHLPGWAAAAIAVPLAASLWTLPLQLLHFGALPLYAVPANLLAAPLLTPLTLGAMAMAVAAVLLPPLVPLLAWGVVPLTQLFIALARTTAALPLAQWQLGRMAPLPVLLLSLALLPWLLPMDRLLSGRRRLLRGAGALLLSGVITLQPLHMGGDQLLLVDDGNRDLLVARHGGRGALISRQGDGLSCSRSRQLATALGVQRYDWILLLDPLASEQPDCWRALTPTLLAQQDGSPALQLGQRLTSPGLSVAPLTGDSQALALQAGRRRWTLLPDRQAWWSWQRSGGDQRFEGQPLWLGFAPTRAEQRQLQRHPQANLWRSTAGSGSGSHPS
ncbi:MAG: ComEC/Rec2 family competence protein [Vulcanococcus sp.]